MKASPRLVLPLVGAVVLTGAVLGTVLWPEPSTSVPVEEPSTSAAAAQGTSASRLPTALPGKPMFSSGSSRPRPQAAERIDPDEPQTAQWKLGKTQRSNALLARDVEKLERERNVATARGDEAERQRLDTVIQQHRERMQEMREEIESLSVQASSDLPDR